jgi:hypothetical protein
MRRTFVLLLVASAVCIPDGASAQSVEVFRSTQSANLPTARTTRGGNLLFEISHRFVPGFDSGTSSLWGLDGPVFNRLGIAYAATDRVLVGVQRSNLDGNLELNLKGRFLEGELGTVRYQVAAMGGIAWNFNAFPVDTPGELVEDNESQYYGQLIVNARVADLGIGVVPTGFRNPRITDVDPVSTFALGLYGQYWFTPGVSALVEWNLSEESVDYANDAVAFGVELQTRGHSFKLLATNQVRLNPTQYLVGTDRGYAGEDWSFGFNITRVLAF